MKLFFYHRVQISVHHSDLFSNINIVFFQPLEKSRLLSTVKSESVLSVSVVFSDVSTECTLENIKKARAMDICYYSRINVDTL